VYAEILYLGDAPGPLLRIGFPYRATTGAVPPPNEEREEKMSSTRKVITALLVMYLAILGG
jgi:hypothetical protein